VPALHPMTVLAEPSSALCKQIDKQTANVTSQFTSWYCRN